MGRVKKIVSTVLLGAMMFSLVGCDSIFKRTEESKGKTVLAKVDGEKITLDDIQDELDKSVASYVAYYGEDFTKNEEYAEQYSQLKTNVLNNVIAEKVLMAKKDKLKVKYTDEEVQNYVDETVQAIKDNWGEENGYVNYLSQYGYTKKSFEKYLKEDYVITLVTKELVKDISVTDEEIKNYYNENVDSFVLQPGAYISQILFRSELTGYEEALKARELYLQGKTLDEIAATYNDENVCKVENMGHQVYNQEDSKLVKEFVDGFKNLNEGEISNPVETNYGWHLIVVSKVNKETVTKTLDEVKDEIKDTLLKAKEKEEYKKKINEYQKEEDIKIYKDRY